MASSAQRSEDERALPRPELNPLVNPLLADNMGRWAEVYFTSPPEKREEAVVELLRELQTRSSEVESHPASAPVVHEVSTNARPTAFEHAPPHRQLSDLINCDTCGHDNPLSHQFCGMCGAQLGGAPLDDPRVERAYEPLGAANNRAHAPAYAESSSDYREPIEEGPPAEEPRRDLYDLSPFQSLLEREDGSESSYYESPSGRYRPYIGAILAILILALGYAAWKSSRSDQNAQGSPPPPPPAATDTAPAATKTPSPSASAPSQPAEQQPAPAAAANSTARPNPPKPTESPKAPETVVRGTTAPPAMPASQSAANNLEPASFQGSGAEEFATAQHFLHGSTGQARDTAEAAKWLWKSIAKHNGPAMLDLADLYLRGDGVSKNCDQARVLLDSAARRGMAGAGVKLRNLQAFGCQ